MNKSDINLNSLRMAKVLRTNSESHTADVIFIDDGTRYAGVQLMSPYASTNTGRVDIPKPTDPPGDEWDATMTEDRDVFGIVAMIDAWPVLVGFMYPQINQMAFDAEEYPNLRLDRHASNVYTSVNDIGDAEIFHPSETFLKIGSSPAHTDLTGKDFDGNWKIEKSDDKVHFNISVNGGAIAIHASPADILTIFAREIIAISTQEEDISVDAGADVIITGAKIFLN